MENNQNTCRGENANPMPVTKETECDKQGNPVKTNVFDKNHVLICVIRHNVVISDSTLQINCSRLCTPMKNGKPEGTERGYDSKNNVRFERTFDNGISSCVMMYDDKGRICENTGIAIKMEQYGTVIENYKETSNPMGKGSSSYPSPTIVNGMGITYQPGRNPYKERFDDAMRNAKYW